MSNLLKINNSLVRVKVAPDPPVVDTTETWVIKDYAPTTPQFNQIGNN